MLTQSKVSKPSRNTSPEKTYISGDQLSVDDVKVYASVLEKPSDGFPNINKWYDSAAARAGGDDDDDDIDLFDGQSH